MGKFSNLNAKSSTNSGNFLSPGAYLAEIVGVKHKEQGFKGESYIIEFEIKDVLLHRDEESRDGVTFNASRKVGDRVAHVLKLDGEYKELALGNLADFLRVCNSTMNALEGKYVAPNQVVLSDDDPVEAAGEDQPLVGLQLEVHVQGTVTVKKRQAFNQIVYRVPRELLSQVAAA